MKLKHFGVNVEVEDLHQGLILPLIYTATPFRQVDSQKKFSYAHLLWLFSRIAILC